MPTDTTSFRAAIEPFEGLWKKLRIAGVAVLSTDRWQVETGKGGVYRAIVVPVHFRFAYFSARPRGRVDKRV